MKMKLNLLVLMVTSFVLNAWCGQLSGDPAPGRSPGPPESKSTTSILNTNYTTIITTTTTAATATATATTSHIHLTDTNQPISSNVNITDDIQNKSRFSEPPPNDSLVSSRHREHVAKSHGNSATAHHKLIDKLGKTAIKTGMQSVQMVLLINFSTEMWATT